MKTTFAYIGKTNETYLETGMAIFEKRLRHYLPFETLLLPDVKDAGKLSAEQLKIREGELILSKLKPDDGLILLDERGKQYTSTQFAQQMDQWFQMPYRRLIFQVGGAFGFSDAVYERANHKLALSPMTFSHQMVRLFFLEQLYRGMTILRNEPYHNE
jgi:23S rRNA (pseudouridine1915-N3)-methyltransferase